VHSDCAADPSLRQEVVPKLTSGTEFGAAKVVIFNGHQNPDTLLWGFVADKLGRGDVMAPFWRSGAKTPGIDEWVAVLGSAAAHARLRLGTGSLPRDGHRHKVKCLGSFRWHSSSRNRFSTSK
jgi:hypothetical protein